MNHDWRIWYNSGIGILYILLNDKCDNSIRENIVSLMDDYLWFQMKRRHMCKMSFYRNLCSYLYTRKESFEEFYNSLQSDDEKIDFINKLYGLNYGNRGDDEQEFANLYSVNYIQDWYVLRYMYAYAYEYKGMFTRLLTEQSLPGVIDILSIGCGNGIDYWSLREAEQSIIDNNAESERYTIKYTGLDEVNWCDQWSSNGGNYEIYSSREQIVNYEPINAVDYLENADMLPYNVIIFPKSISEFDKDEFARICDVLGTKEFKFESGRGRVYDRNEVHFLISIRKVDGISRVDRERIRLLKEAMEANDFILSNPATVPTQIEEFYMEDGSPIKEHIDNFRYPVDIMGFMMGMSENILEFIQRQPENTFEFTQGKSNGAIEEDVKRMFTPMLKTQYICNTIMTFRRRQ